jgi:hypothetical protein
MAHGLESGASVTHHRGVFGDPEQLVAFNAVLSGEHQHRNSRDPPFDPLAVTAHQLSVPLGSPSVDGRVPAGPILPERSLAVLHAEVMPAALLGQEWIHPLLEQTPVMHKFRGFITAIRGK